MTLKNTKMILVFAITTGIIATMGLSSTIQEASASCWWGCDSGDAVKKMYYKVGYQHPCDNGGNCVTMSNHWQPISSGESDTIGMYTDKEYDWIRPIIQAETRDLTAHASWSAYVLAVDPNNSYVTGGSDTFSKRYIYGVPQAETTFDRSDDSAPKKTLVNARISVTQIAD